MSETKTATKPKANSSDKRIDKLEKEMKALKKMLKERFAGYKE